MIKNIHRALRYKQMKWSKSADFSNQSSAMILRLLTSAVALLFQHIVLLHFFQDSVVGAAEGRIKDTRQRLAFQI